MLSYKSLDVALGFYSLKISGVTDWHTVWKKKKKSNSELFSGSDRKSQEECDP